MNLYIVMLFFLDLFFLWLVNEIDKGNIMVVYVVVVFGNYWFLKVLFDWKVDVNFIWLGLKFINEIVDML